MSVSTGSIWLQSLLRSAWSLVLRDMLMGGGVGVLCSDFFFVVIVILTHSPISCDVEHY